MLLTFKVLEILTTSLGLFVFLKLKEHGFDHDLELVLLLKSKHIKIRELPVNWQHKNNGSLNIFWDPIKMFIGIFTINLRYL